MRKSWLAFGFLLGCSVPALAAYAPGTFGTPVGVPNSTPYSPLPVVTPEMWEIPGTIVPGSTDETAYIQDAINFLQNSGATLRGGIVQLGNRDYYEHTGPIVNRNGVTIQGTCGYQGVWPLGNAATAPAKCTGLLNDSTSDWITVGDLNEIVRGIDFKGPVPIFNCNIGAANSGAIISITGNYPGFGVPNGTYPVTIGGGFNGNGTGGSATITVSGGIMSGSALIAGGSGYYQTAAGGSLAPPSCTVSAATLGVSQPGAAVHFITGATSDLAEDNGVYSATQGFELSAANHSSQFFENIEIRQNNIQGPIGNGIKVIDSGQGLIVRNNLVQYPGQNGIWLPNRNTAVIIDDNNIDAVYAASGSCINVGGIDAGSSTGGILSGGGVTNNECGNVTGPNGNEIGISTSAAWGTNSSFSEGYVFSGNVIYGPVPTAADVERTQNSQIGPNVYGSSTNGTGLVIGGDVSNNIILGAITAPANSNTAAINNGNNTFIGAVSPLSWTPGLTDGTHHSTNSSAAGWYYVSGPLVTVEFSLQTSSLGSLSGALSIDALPIATANIASSLSAVGACATATGLTFTSNYTTLAINATPNSSKLGLLQNGSGQATTALVASNLNTTSILNCQITYRSQ